MFEVFLHRDLEIYKTGSNASLKRRRRTNGGVGSGTNLLLFLLLLQVFSPLLRRASRVYRSSFSSKRSMLSASLVNFVETMKLDDSMSVVVVQNVGLVVFSERREEVRGERTRR